MSKKLSDPTIPELTAVANNARIYVLLMDEPEGSRDRYMNVSLLASSSNSNVVSGNGSGNVTSHSSTTVNNIVVYATTDGTGVKDSGISRDALSIAITKANSALQSGDLAGYADKPYVNSAANIANSVAVSIGASSNAWTNTSMATLPTIYASHANVTANVTAMLAYANGTANIANSVAVGIGGAGNTYAASVGAASNTLAVGVGAASNAWTNAAVAGLFNLSTMNLDNINESSSNIHFKPSHLADLRNVMNGNSNVTIVLPALLANLNSVPVTENTIVYGAGTGTFGIEPLTEFVRGLFLGTNAKIFRAQTASQVELVWTSYAGIGLNLNADQWVVIQGFAQSGQAVSYEISRGPGQNNELYITNKGSNSIVFVSNAAFIYHNSDKIWTEGSDGPGTGLDADTVDGIQGAALFNLATMNLDNINESSSNIHFKRTHLSDLQNVMNGNIAISIGASSNSWTNTVAASINSYINASTSGAYSPPALIANLANLGVSTSNAFIYATSTTTWGYLDSIGFRTLVGAQADLTSAQQIELHSGGSGDRYAFIDFHAQDGVDYSARIIRNPGANGTLVISNIGYGDVYLTPSNTGVFRVTTDVYGGNFISQYGSFYSYALGGLNAHYWFADENGNAKGVAWWNRASDSMNLMNWTASTNILSQSADAIWRIGSNTIYHQGNILDAAGALGIDGSIQAINETTSNNYTLVIGDKGKMVASNVIIAGANANVQIPNFGQVAFSNGTRIDIAKWGNTNTRITTSNGIILNGNYHATLELDGRYVAVGMHMQKPNVWHAYGAANRLQLSELRQINASNSSTSTGRIPSDVQFGDLLFLYDFGVNGSGIPTDTYETNWIPIASRAYSTTTRLSLSMKIAEDSDANSTVTGLSGDTTNRHIIIAWRGNVPISNAYIATLSNVAASDADQAQQLQNVVPPGIVFAAYRSSGAVDPRTFNLTSNGERRATTSEYVKWHTANTATANAIIDMADEGSGNFLFSGTIICQ